MQLGTLCLCKEKYKNRQTKKHIRILNISTIFITFFCDVERGVCEDRLRQELSEGAVHQETGKPPLHY